VGAALYGAVADGIGVDTAIRAAVTGGVSFGIFLVVVIVADLVKKS
jgi:hypothetical protein